MNKLFKYILAIVGLGLMAYLGFWVYSIVSFTNVFSTRYSKKDLVENYNQKSQEITELRNYIKSIVPVNMSVDVEFEGNSRLSIFHIANDGKYDNNWGINVGSIKADSLLKKLGWTYETLSTLKQKLDDANCISIESGEPCTIGYQRSGMGKYFYKVFNKVLSDSLKKQFNDGCCYIYYKDNIVLGYGGGTLGPDCFEDVSRDD